MQVWYDAYNELNNYYKYTIFEAQIPATDFQANEYKDIDIDVSKSGWTPVGCIGWVLNTATAICTVYIGMISVTTLRLRLKNTINSSHTIPISGVNVLYRK